MPSSTVEVQEDAVHLDLSSDPFDKLGWRNGQWIEVSQSGECITLRRSGAADRSIIRSALGHLETPIGFDTGIDRQTRRGDRFEV
jgi:hypothetical protein